MEKDKNEVIKKAFALALKLAERVDGDVVLATGQTGDWTKIEVDGQVGYVYTKYAVTGTELKKYIQKNILILQVIQHIQQKMVIQK